MNLYILIKHFSQEFQSKYIKGDHFQSTYLLYVVFQINHVALLKMSSPWSLRMYLLIKWHRSAKRQGMWCYSLRRNQKTHLRIVPSFAISPTLIPGVPPVLNRVNSDRKQWKICPVMALLEKQITSHMFHYTETFLTKTPIISFSSQNYIIEHSHLCSSPKGRRNA